METKYKMKIANNRSTKEMVGYWVGKYGVSITVVAYDVDTLQKKFDKKVKLHKVVDKFFKGNFTINKDKTITYTPKKSSDLPV